jgi:RNA recognition motif-containing protein
MTLKSIYVGNLPFKSTEAELKTHFSKFGTVVNTRIPRDQQNRSRGFGFVDFDKEVDIAILIGTEMEGRVLNLKEAISKKKYEPRPVTA